MGQIYNFGVLVNEGSFGWAIFLFGFKRYMFLGLFLVAHHWGSHPVGSGWWFERLIFVPQMIGNIVPLWQTSLFHETGFFKSNI